MSQIENVKQLHNDGQIEAAIQGYQEILKSEPNNDEAHFGLAHANSRINQLKVALKHAKEAVKLAPNSDRYLQFAAQMMLANNQFDDALKTFKRSLQENPNLFYSYLAIGDIYAIKAESKQAKEQYNLALKVHQEGIPAIVKLARLHILEGNYSEAEDLLQKAELQFPAEPSLKLQMGILKLEQSETGFAELYFKKILEDEPDNHVAKAYLSMSLLYSDPQAADDIITELIEQKIKLPEVMAALGLLMVKNKKYTQAIQYLMSVCQSRLAYPSWLMGLARAYIGNAQPNSAQQVLQLILSRGENNQALLMLGQIHQQNANHATAIKVLQRITEESSEHQHALLMQAECHYAAKAYQKALKIIEKILTKQPNHSSAIKLKLNALAQLGNYDDALVVIKNTDSNLQLDEFNQLMHLYSGLLLDEKQAYDEAWEHFSKIEPAEATSVKLLTSEEEKQIQGLPSQPAESLFNFVFADPATGYYDFIKWLQSNDITALVDRYTSLGRKDLFAEEWSVKEITKLDETKIHFLRKKYIKQLNLLINDDTQQVADFIPFSPINLAVIKRIFPKANVMVLSRNFADLRLHHSVFGGSQVHFSQFSKVINQMVAMNPNLSLCDIDAWQAGDESTIKQVEKIFGKGLTAFELQSETPLDRRIFPYMHWKNYQQQLNQ